MVLNVPCHADLLLSQEKRQQKIDTRLIRANAKRKFIDYQPGMQVCLLTGCKSELNEVCKGPCEIVHTHANGTVAIRLSADATDRVNIRRLKPA